MLKIRVIPCLLFNDRTIVKSVKFDELRMFGDPTTVARVFNERNADELIFLDIMASRRNVPPNFKVIEDIAYECFMPLTVGGGIRHIEEVDKLFQIGADKICVNTALVKKPKLLKQIVQKYGSQALVVSIDAKKEGESYRTFISSGKEATEYTPVALAKRAMAMGAGEILLNSIDRDGTREGYDIELVKEVANGVTIPVIAAGGCGNLQHAVEVIKEGQADAISAATIFYYVGESIITIKKYLAENDLPVRLP